ncbi:MAG: beta-ketoacyl synthase N-terminal-like domain-containing protein [Bacteroidota bacterium]
MTNIYINGSGNVSPQKTGDNRHFLEEPLSFESNRLKCLDPDYREFIPAEMIRRMGRIIKMGIAASKMCMQDAANGRQDAPDACGTPDAIITGTGSGCVEDTEKFLVSMIRNREEFLTPTSFIQSTHNTVAGQIALLLKCHGYNFTYVHRGVSFESALIDAMTQIELGECSNVLVGGTDELTANTFAITSRLGYWKQKPVNTFNLLNDSQRGSVAGEGAAFFLLENRKNRHTYAKLEGVSTFLKPASAMEVGSRLQDFLATRRLNISDIGLVLMGLSGDPAGDLVYHDLAEAVFQQTPLAYFKHLCGEYHTATAFATWLASMVLKNRHVPEVIRVSPTAVVPNRVLIYNHYRGSNHAFILLSRPE